MSNAATSLCPKCGQSFDASRATYDKNGNLQCDACATKAQIDTGNARAAVSLDNAAWGVLGTGLASLFCFNPFGITAIVTIISGASWLFMVAGNPSQREAMGRRYTTGMIVTILGTLMGVLSAVIVVLRLMGFVFGL